MLKLQISTENAAFDDGIEFELCRILQNVIKKIEHAIKDWNGQGEFISFLASRYCPLNSDTDNGTCQFWSKNVKYYYNK